MWNLNTCTQVQRINRWLPDRRKWGMGEKGDGMECRLPVVSHGGVGYGAGNTVNTVAMTVWCQGGTRLIRGLFASYINV